jgi:hypothetical protein
LKHRLVLMGIDLPIGVWMVLALLAVILVVVSASRGLEKLISKSSGFPDDLEEGALGGEHIWAGTFVWLLIIVLALYALS